jgi:hypothetical protein
MPFGDVPLTPREQQLLAAVRELKAKDVVQQSIHALFRQAASSSSSSSSSSGKGRRSNFGSGNRSSKDLIPNVSKEDFARCWKENLCLNCKQPGHKARECKNEFSLKF